MNVQAAHKSTANYLKQGLWEYVIRESVPSSRPNNDNNPSFDVPPPSKVVPPRFLVGKSTATSSNNKVATTAAVAAPSHQPSPVAQPHICHPSTLHRPANSSDSIGNEMTHFKPIRLMPISDQQPNGGDTDAVADTAPMVLHAPKVRYVKTAETLFAPAKSKFKPETPQKVRKSAFVLVPKATPLKQHNSANATVSTAAAAATTTATTTTTSNNHHHHRTTTPPTQPPPSKPNTRKSAEATNGSGSGSGSSGIGTGNNGTAKTSTAAPSATNDVHSYSVQHSNKSKQRLMCNIALDQEHRQRILQQERGDYELAKMLQKFDAQPRVTRPGKAAAAPPNAAHAPAKSSAKTRSSMSDVPTAPARPVPHGSAAARRKHHSTSSAASVPTATTAATAAASNNHVNNADTSPKRYFLRTRFKANEPGGGEASNNAANVSIANGGRARVKRSASGKRKANGC